MVFLLVPGRGHDGHPSWFALMPIHRVRRGLKQRIQELLAGGNNSITLFIAIA
jgi:hypothetical protein